MEKIQISEIYTKPLYAIFSMLIALQIFFSCLSFCEETHTYIFAVSVVSIVASFTLVSFGKKDPTVQALASSLRFIAILAMLIGTIVVISSGPAKQTVEPMPASYFEQTE